MIVNINPPCTKNIIHPLYIYIYEDFDHLLILDSCASLSR